MLIIPISMALKLRSDYTEKSEVSLGARNKRCGENAGRALFL
jgi:hypothetical protein